VWLCPRAFAKIPTAMNRPFSAISRAVAVVLVCAAVAGCPGGARETGLPASAERPTESLQIVMAHAEESFRDGDYVEAQMAYEQALQIEPGQARATVNLATCYLKNRFVKKAQDLLEVYLARHPDDPAARLVQARTLMRLGDLQAAGDSLRQVLRTNPDLVMAHYNLGFVAYRSGRYAEAEEHLKRACELKPDLPDAFYTLGLTSLALKRYPEAIASLEKAVQVDPKHVGARFNLANAYARAGRLQDAEKQQAVYADLSGHSKSQKERETQIKASSVKGIQFLLDKKYPEALQEYQVLSGRFPDDASIHSQIGQILIILSRRDEAFTALRKATELDPKLSDPHYLLSGLYRERGDAQAADRELTTFAALETIPEGKSGY
jgi:tetratricopeptide (TPR) repeat protein